MSFDPHQLYYLMAQMGELDLNIGPLDVRSEHVLTSKTSANYVSFLHQSGYGSEQGERGSIRSVSSVRSVAASISDMFRGLGPRKQVPPREKLEAQFSSDLTYIFSAFTKIPSLKLAPASKQALIAGYQGYPFDTAVPLVAFKNLSHLEISDLDYRDFFGWHLLADSLRSLIMKRAKLSDPTDLLLNIVIDDMDNRRRPSGRSNPQWKATSPTSWSQLQDSPLGAPVPTIHRSYLRIDGEDSLRERDNASNGQRTHQSKLHQRDSPLTQSVASPPNSPHTISSPRRAKRSGSGSSNSSRASLEPFRRNSQPLLIPQTLPESKWHFLKHLGLPNNSLAFLSISCLESLHSTLQSLDLSSNLFTEIPNCVAQCVNLRALDMSNCMLERLLEPSHLCPSITTLSVRANRLSSGTGIADFPSLRRLDLRDNILGSSKAIEDLSSLPGLRELWVVRNPLTKSAAYRSSVFSLFQSRGVDVPEIVLDARGPTAHEKRTLHNIVDRVPVTSGQIPTLKAKDTNQCHAEAPLSRDQASPTPCNTGGPKAVTEPHDVRQSMISYHVVPPSDHANQDQRCDHGDKTPSEINLSIRNGLRDQQQSTYGSKGAISSKDPGPCLRVMRHPQATRNEVQGDSMRARTDDAWSDFESPYDKRETIKQPKYPGKLDSVPSLPDALQLKVHNSEGIQSF